MEGHCEWPEFVACRYSMTSSSDKQKIVEALTLLGSIKSPSVRDALDSVKLQLVECLSGASHATDTAGRTVATPELLPADALAIPRREPGPSQFEVAGSSKAEAAVHIIRVKGRACKPRELIEEMRKMGVEDVEGKNATNSLIKSLARRAQKTGDVFKVPGGVGKWDLTEHYTPAQVMAMLSTFTANEALAKEKQRERTMAGLARAKARGSQVGQPSKLTAEMAAEFKCMMLEGAKSSEFCERFKISRGSFYNYRDKLENWNIGDPWPPEEKEDRPERLRVVK